MRVLVTGSRGKVGRHVVAALGTAGHEVDGTDIVRADYSDWTASYVRADLCDYGQAIDVVLRSDPDVVVHTAGIPSGQNDPSSTIFATNAVGTFNITEAAARAGVRRLVNISSETVTGFPTARRPDAPDYFPVDEDHPLRPQEAYALSKSVGESVCDAAVRRSDLTAVSIRASFVLASSDYDVVRRMFDADPAAGHPNGWSYIDVLDLAALAVLAAEAATPGHEVVYAAAGDNIIGRPLAELIALVDWHRVPELRELGRADASGINSAKAERLFDWRPTRSWRDNAPRIDSGPDS